MDIETRHRSLNYEGIYVHLEIRCKQKYRIKERIRSRHTAFPDIYFSLVQKTSVADAMMLKSVFLRLAGIGASFKISPLTGLGLLFKFFPAARRGQQTTLGLYALNPEALTP